MPSFEEHRLQAEHNYRFIKVIDGAVQPNEYDDWVVTVCFYAAVHLVEAAISVAGIIAIREDVTGPSVNVENPGHSECLSDRLRRSSPHLIRKYILEWNGKAFPGCQGPYTRLWENSRAARYSGQKIHSVTVLKCRESLEHIIKMLASKVQIAP